MANHTQKITLSPSRDIPFTDTMRDRLSAFGLFHEIISWQLRLFVPVDGSGPEVLAKILERYPLERIDEREAA